MTDPRIPGDPEPGQGPSVLPVAAALIGLGAIVGAGFLITTRRFMVEGRSMMPAYGPGDRVLVNRLAYVRSRPRSGEVVIVRQAGSEGREDIKRIAAGPGQAVEVRGETMTLGPDEWFVLGDNASESTDSRELGPIRKRDIIGKVLIKY